MEMLERENRTLKIDREERQVQIKKLNATLQEEKEKNLKNIKLSSL